MTPEQSKKVELLSHCTFLPGSWPKQFVRMMCSKDFANAEMTPKQAYWIDRLYYTYRNQIQVMDRWLYKNDAPPFVNPIEPPESVTIQESEWREDMDRTDKLKSKRQREAKEKLERWNKTVGS